jgi:hypothetical protein
MPQNIFKIRRAFVIPFMIIIFLLFLLLLLSIFKGQIREGVILSVFFILILFVGIETLRREIILTEKGLKIKKFFRVKEFVWTQITNLGIVELRKKIYFLLTTTKGFYYFSNLVENHALLIRSLIDKLGDEKVEPEVKSYLDRPIERLSLIVMSWISAAVIIVIIILIIGGFK